MLLKSEARGCSRVKLLNYRRQPLTGGLLCNLGQGHGGTMRSRAEEEEEESDSANSGFSPLCDMFSHSAKVLISVQFSAECRGATVRTLDGNMIYIL